MVYLFVPSHLTRRSPPFCYHCQLISSQRIHGVMIVTVACNYSNNCRSELIETSELYSCDFSVYLYDQKTIDCNPTSFAKTAVQSRIMICYKDNGCSPGVGIQQPSICVHTSKSQPLHAVTFRDIKLLSHMYKYFGKY